MGAPAPDAIGETNPPAFAGAMVAWRDGDVRCITSAVTFIFDTTGTDTSAGLLAAILGRSQRQFGLRIDSLDWGAVSGA